MSSEKMTSGKMAFQELVEKSGFATAVLILHERGEKIEDLCKSLQEWLKVYQATPCGSELESLAITKIGKTAKSFEDWLTVYNRVSRSELKRLALQKMSKF